MSIFPHAGLSFVSNLIPNYVSQLDFYGIYFYYYNDV